MGRVRKRGGEGMGEASGSGPEDGLGNAGCCGGEVFEVELTLRVAEEDADATRKGVGDSLLCRLAGGEDRDVGWVDVGEEVAECDGRVLVGDVADGEDAVADGAAG